MATAGELHPTEGIRLLLERDSVSDDGGAASYRGAIYTPTEASHYRAELERGVGATLTATAGPAAAPDAEKKLHNLAKSTARAAARNEADGLPPWPERILRWRPPKKD